MARKCGEHLIKKGYGTHFVRDWTPYFCIVARLERADYLLKG